MTRGDRRIDSADRPPFGQATEMSSYSEAREILPERADFLVELRGFEPLTSAVRLGGSLDVLRGADATLIGAPDAIDVPRPAPREKVEKKIAALMREGSQSWQVQACCKAGRRPIKRHACATHWVPPSSIKRSPCRRIATARRPLKPSRLCFVWSGRRISELRCVVMTALVRSRTPVMPKEHPTVSSTTSSAGPPGFLRPIIQGHRENSFEQPDELVSCPHRIAAVQDPHGGQMARDIAQAARSEGP